MKARSIFLSLLLAATAFTFSNCVGNKKDESHDEQEQVTNEELVSESTTDIDAAEPQFVVDSSFQRQLSGVFNSYVSLKEAFVSSDVTKVSTEAASASKSLAGVDMKLLLGAAHNDWMNYRGGMGTALETIGSSPDIEAQREAFNTLSDNLYKSIKAYGLGGATAYYDFCPMAFDNQGGFWLSDNEEIRNPYFGDRMLTCGSVKEKLR